MFFFIVLAPDSGSYPERDMTVRGFWLLDFGFCSHVNCFESQISCVEILTSRSNIKVNIFYQWSIFPSYHIATVFESSPYTLGTLHLKGLRP